jgi:hypothetical protein
MLPHKKMNDKKGPDEHGSTRLMHKELCPRRNERRDEKERQFIYRTVIA